LNRKKSISMIIFVFIRFFAKSSMFILGLEKSKRKKNEKQYFHFHFFCYKLFSTLSLLNVQNAIYSFSVPKDQFKEAFYYSYKVPKFFIGVLSLITNAMKRFYIVRMLLDDLKRIFF
jgi:uncharacterized membrane protein YiaA